MCSTCSVRIMEAITEGQPGHWGAVDTVLSLGSWVTGVLWTQSSPWGGHKTCPPGSGHRASE